MAPQVFETIAECIARLARKSGSSVVFVYQVRQLFLSKGISLELDAVPYKKALIKAFERERKIRRDALRKTVSNHPAKQDETAQFSTDSDEFPTMVPGPKGEQ